MADTYTAEKLAAVDRVLLDPRVTDQDFRVFYYLASATDRETRLANRKQKTIAFHLHRKGKTERNSIRGIQVSIDRLALLGHLQVVTREGSTYANAYRVVPEKANTASPSASEKANGGSPFSQPKRRKANGDSSSAEKRRMEDAKKANGSGEKGEPSFVSILPFNSRYSLRARATSSAKALVALGEKLQRAIGADAVHAWFRMATIVDVSDDTVTIEVQSEFVRDRVAFNYEAQLRAFCRALVPSIASVRFTVAASQVAA